MNAGSLLRCLGLALFALAAQAACAAISCTISSPGVTMAYPANTAPVSTQTSFTVTCARNLASDPTSISYTVAADNGLNPNGTNNRAFSGANALKYDVYRDAACSSTWKGPQTIADSITTLSGFTPVSKTTAFWGCVVTAQSPSAGTYTDTVTMTLTYGTSTAVNTFPVSIATPATCSVTTAPGPVAFGTYVALGSAVNASASFAVTCTNYLPYTMSLDAGSGVIVGLRYTLALDAASSTGTGAAQTHSITGNLAAGQAGTCSAATCSGSQTRTLTITY
ncbi:MAG: spore coat protein U domain-containing protein [Bacillota bacterium]